jgi:plastocyanin
LLQAGILDSFSGDLPEPTYYRIPSWGEESGQPAYAGRISWSGRALGQKVTVGTGGFYGRQYWGFGRNVNGWASTTDLTLPLGNLFEFSGQFYRGKAVAGLGGGLGQDIVFADPMLSQGTVIQGLDSMGGWVQLKLLAFKEREPVCELYLPAAVRCAFLGGVSQAQDLRSRRTSGCGKPYNVQFGIFVLMRGRMSDGKIPIFVRLCLPALLATAVNTHAQQKPVTVQVEVEQSGAVKQTKKAGAVPDNSDVAVWLTPADRSGTSAVAPRQIPRLVQRNKTFDPHVLMVQAGTNVEFPNEDPYFHNVFSLFNGKRFDLGLYEAGSSKTVQFDRPGISFLFCNIHEEMSAVVIAVDTPYYGLSDRMGRVAIPNVPDGRYQMHVWYERSSPDDLKKLDRNVTISATARSLELVQVTNNSDFTLAHKNKYGQEYVPPPASGYGTP